jgi:hypothetical protein
VDYSTPKAFKVWAKDIFVPKLKRFEGKGPSPVCEGDVCSTGPANAMAAAGRKAIHGKAPEDAYPTDFLRSPEYEAVGHISPQESSWSPGMRKAMPYLSRAGMGLALAGGTYAVSKDPLAAAGIGGGAIAGDAVATALANRRNVLAPSIPEAAMIWGEKPERNAFLKNRLPYQLGGMALGYGAQRGVKALVSKYQQRRQARNATEQEAGKQAAMREFGVAFTK